MDNSEQKKVRRKGSRSPNYPVVTLKKSVEQVGQLYDTHKTHNVPVHMVHELWGYKANGSVGDQCVAAAKAFGLINIEGRGKSRKVCISDQGHRIHMKALNHEDLLKKAALSPSIYSEIWEHFQGDLPNDGLLKNYLLWEHQPRFNEKHVDSFIALFRESISFANLTSGDIIKDDGTKSNTSQNEKFDNNKPRGNIPMSSKTSDFDLPIPLLDGLSAFLRIPRPMSEANYSLLVKFLEAIKPSIIFKPKQGESQEKTDEINNNDGVEK